MAGGGRQRRLGAAQADTERTAYAPQPERSASRRARRVPSRVAHSAVHRTACSRLRSRRFTDRRATRTRLAAAEAAVSVTAQLRAQRRSQVTRPFTAGLTLAGTTGFRSFVQKHVTMLCILRLFWLPRRC